MTRKEPTETRNARERAVPAFIFEDRTDARTRAAMMEALAALHWVQFQRARGNQPN